MARVTKVKKSAVQAAPVTDEQEPGQAASAHAAPGYAEPALANNVNLFGQVVKATADGLLSQKFVYPPFSVWSARDGFWQERKRGWVALGIQSELGRGGAATFGMGINPYDGNARSAAAAATSKKEILSTLNKAAPGGSAMPALVVHGGHRGTGSGKPVAGAMRGNPQAGQTLADGTPLNRGGVDTATSIFDPVVCELAYRWFCPPGGQVVDPFSGGSVRGIVASLLGLKYWGSDLSAPQIEANREQAKKLCPAATRPAWVCGDSGQTLASAPQADFVFSCPPYGDLEVYSDDPRDLSTMGYDNFIEAYDNIIQQALAKLKRGCYACFVVGDYRDSLGNYVGFVADTIKAFQSHGAPLYNEAILVTAVGSLPVRTSAQFEKSRKLGKTHQNVLVFRKA